MPTQHALLIVRRWLWTPIPDNIKKYARRSPASQRPPPDFHVKAVSKLLLIIVLKKILTRYCRSAGLKSTTAKYANRVFDDLVILKCTHVSSRQSIPCVPCVPYAGRSSRRVHVITSTTDVKKASETTNGTININVIPVYNPGWTRNEQRAASETLWHRSTGFRWHAESIQLCGACPRVHVVKNWSKVLLWLVDKGASYTKLHTLGVS